MRGTGSSRRFNRIQNRLELTFVDDRAKVVRVRGSHAQRLCTLDETVAEAFVDAVEDDDAAAGGASLPGIAECRQRSPARRFIQIRIVTNYEGVLAAELERDTCKSLPGNSLDLTTDARRASKADHPDVAMCDQGGTGFAAEAMNHIQHASGKPGRSGNVSEERGGRRRVFRGLEHRCVSAHKCREDFPGDVGDGRIGGHDEAGDADRLTDGHGPTADDTARRGSPVDPLALAGEKQSQLNRSGRLTRSIFRRLAGFRGDYVRKLRGAILHRPDDLMKDQTTLNRRRGGPGRLHGHCRADRVIDVVSGRARNR